jgi:hypothetical protein
MFMGKKKELRTKVLRVNITPSEYAGLRSRFQSTTHRGFSEFVRSILREEPVVKKYRNSSLDEILEALVDIKNIVTSVDRSPGDAEIEIIKYAMIKIYEKCGQGASGLQS